MPKATMSMLVACAAIVALAATPVPAADGYPVLSGNRAFIENQETVTMWTIQ